MPDPQHLDTLDDDELDALPYGVIRLDAEGRVDRLNRAAALVGGVQRWRVLGRSFQRELARMHRFRRYRRVGGYLVLDTEQRD